MRRKAPTAPESFHGPAVAALSLGRAWALLFSFLNIMVERAVRPPSPFPRPFGERRRRRARVVGDVARCGGGGLGRRA